jgi:cholesterol transport system auxiliary component
MKHVRAVLYAGTLLSLVLMIAGCASPRLSLYTLESPSPLATERPLSPHSVVVEVRRVVIPDALDTQDIVVRNGNQFDRSSTGRWATRLSMAITHYLTGQLAARRPNALVTDQTQIGTPNDRLYIAISTLDITSAGQAALEADWTIVPRNPSLPDRRQRGRFTTQGPVATDHDVVVLLQDLLKQLADAIDIASLR